MGKCHRCGADWEEHSADGTPSGSDAERGPSSSRVPRAELSFGAGFCRLLGDQVCAFVDSVDKRSPRTQTPAVGEQQLVEQLRSANERIQEELRATRIQLESLRSAFRAIPRPHRVFWKNRDHVFQDVNGVFASDFNMSVDEVRGGTDYDLGFLEDQIEFFHTCDREVMTSKTSLTNVVEPQQRDGQTAWLSTSKAPVLDRAGEVTGLIGVYTDITHLKDAEHQLQEKMAALSTSHGALVEDRDSARRAMRARCQRMANVSHELRTPMNGIIGLCAELAEDHDLPPAARHLVEIVRHSAQSLRVVVDDLLDLSKIDERKLELYPRPSCIATETRETLSLMRPLATEKGLELALKTSVPEGVLFNLDANRYAQILRNLLGNAIKFTDSGCITVRILAGSSRAGAEEITLEVEDTGPGIASDQLDLVFEEFTQVAGCDRRNHGGAGLGLAITKRLVELMEGRLSVESCVGVGSIFKVLLPLSRVGDSHGPAKQTAATCAPPEFDGMRVLVAEDNIVNQRVIVKLLERMDVAVTVVEDGAAAVESVRRNKFDLVLMDIQMPKLDGVEATRRIRQIPRMASTPIVALTASALESDKERFRSVGIEEVIAKPIDSRELALCLGRFYTKPNGQDAQDNSS